jgi:hypothetical protein
MYWKKCQPSLSSVHCGHAVLYNYGILYGGGGGFGDNKRKIIRFDLNKAKWEDFSFYLYEHFAMGVVMGKLLLVVGGYNTAKDEYSNQLSQWRNTGCNWVRIQGSPLPTPRADAVVQGYKKWLIAAGGFNGEPLDRVDILDCESFGQWHSLHMSLPRPAYALQSAFYQDQSGTALWYLMSTSRGCGLSGKRPVYFISMTNLLEKRGSWAELPDPPLSNSGAVTVRGHLLAVGGRDPHGCKKDVHMFFFGTNEWLKVAELQSPRHSVTCVNLSSVKSKFVVLGGGSEDEEEDFSCKVDQYDINID